jgi:hypothetical protein
MSTLWFLLENLGSTPTTRPSLLPAKLQGVALGDAADLRLPFEVNLPSPKLHGSTRVSRLDEFMLALPHLRAGSCRGPSGSGWYDEGWQRSGSGVGVFGSAVRVAFKIEVGGGAADHLSAKKARWRLAD